MRAAKPDRLPSGSWRIRWTEPDGTRAGRTFKTSEEAIAFREAIDPALRHGQPVAKVRPHLFSDGSRFRIPARGHHVYLLHAADDTILYVGRSSNILKRLGDHLHIRGRRDVVAYASIIPCADEDEMKQLETALIYQHQPELNTRGLAGRPRSATMNGTHVVTTDWISTFSGA